MPPKKSSRNNLLAILAILLCGVLIYFCVSRIDGEQFLLAIRSVHVSYLLGGACFTLLILFLSSAQFKILLPKEPSVSYFKLFQIVSIFSMTVNLIPFWGGHALFIYLVGKKEKVGVAPAISAMTLEQIADGFAKLFIFGLVSILIPFPAWMYQGIRSLVILVTCFYLLVFYFAFRYRNLNQKKEFAPVGWHKILHFAANWAYHLHALRSFPKSIGTFLFAIGMKLCEVMAVWMVQKSFGLDFSFSGALLMVAALCIATTLPISPGRLGIFEATAVLIYQYLGLDASKALALGLIIHIIHTVPFLIVGYLNSIWMGFKRKEIEREMNAEEIPLGSIE